MTKFQALVVKYWRVREEYSWRMVHALWQKRYVPKDQWFYNQAIINAHNNFPEILGEYNYDYPDGNQIYGMDLCGEAMELLNEKVEDGWN